MEIGVDSAAMFHWIPRRTERPIAAYGTSILQGGCASRPGMAWTNILSRRLDRTVLNFGFSGNGQMDPELIEALAGTDARLYILDCIPNLTGFDDSVFTARYIDGITRLRSRSDAPILLAEDVGGSEGFAYPASVNKNRLLKACYDRLKEQGIENLHYLSCEEIGMPEDGTVDGIHLTDLGMKTLAEAHERKIREILHETDGVPSTTRAVTQRREFPGYEWLDRHEALKELNRRQPPRNVIIGNSITHYWGGSDGQFPENGPRSWKKHMAPAGFRNLGYGNDRIENVLWRVRHGELDGYRAERVVLLIGINNFSCNDDEQIASGIARLVEAVRDRQPDARIEVLGILPCRHGEPGEACEQPDRTGPPGTRHRLVPGCRRPPAGQKRLDRRSAVPRRPPPERKRIRPDRRPHRRRTRRTISPQKKHIPPNDSGREPLGRLPAAVICPDRLSHTPIYPSFRPLFRLLPRPKHFSPATISSRPQPPAQISSALSSGNLPTGPSPRPVSPPHRNRFRHATSASPKASSVPNEGIPPAALFSPGKRRHAPADPPQTKRHAFCPERSGRYSRKNE